MTLKECYAALEGDYDGAMGRLGERILKKFAVKFLSDGSMDLLRTSMESGDAPEAFRAAHTIKGVCLNLGFTKLATSSSELTEALRDATDVAGGRPYFPQVEADYAQTVSAIQQLDA